MSNDLHDGRGYGNGKQDTNERELSKRVTYIGVNSWKNWIYGEKDEMALGGCIEEEESKDSEINYVRLTTFSSLTEGLDSSHTAALD